MMKQLKKYYDDALYRNSIALMLTSAFGAFFGLLFWIVAARTMSAKDIGLATATLSAAALIIALSRLGFDQGLLRYLPEMKQKNGFYSTIVILTLALTLIITGVFLAGVNVFSPALSFLREGWFLPIFFAYIAIMSIYSVQNVALIAIRRADLSLIQNLMLGARIPILIFLTSLGVLGVLSAFGIAFLMTLIFGALILPRYGLSIVGNFDIAYIRKTLKFSLGNYLTGILMMMPITIMPIMIVNTIGAEEGAYFYVAYSIASFLIMIPNAISTSLFVEGSHSLPLKVNVLKSVKFVLMLLVPALILIFLFGDQVLLLFGKVYSEQAYEMLQLLAFSSIFSAVTSIFISIKKIQKDVRMIIYVNFTLAVLIIGVGYVALLKYGLLGLGYAWLGTNVIVCAMVIGVMVWKEKWV